MKKGQIFMLIVELLLFGCSEKRFSNTKELLKLEIPLVKDFGTYNLNNKIIEIVEEENFLKIYLIEDSLRCDLLERNSSAYSRFFVYNENDTVLWIYSGDTGLFKSVISDSCKRSVKQVPIDSDDLPQIVRKELTKKI